MVLKLFVRRKGLHVHEDAVQLKTLEAARRLSFLEHDTRRDERASLIGMIACGSCLLWLQHW